MKNIWRENAREQNKLQGVLILAEQDMAIIYKRLK